MIFKKNKKLKLVSVKAVIILIFGLTFLNLSWKTSKDTKLDLHSEISEDSVAITTPSAEVLFNNFVNDVYEKAQLQKANLALPVFEKAMTGFLNLKSIKALNSDKEIITVVDFSKASTSKRMWIVDVKNKTLLLNTYVAHGQGSGGDMATNFSNVAESHQSSLGFYVTNETYFGKHGLSLKLDGFDKGVNDLARNRAIVIHGAKYVSEDFIKRTGRLGRSFGCPAVSEELNEKVIELIKNKTCLFINGSSQSYQSNLLDYTTLDTQLFGASTI